MSDKKTNNTASAEHLRGKLASVDKEVAEASQKKNGNAPDAVDDSEIDIQELLKRYLPDYAEESEQPQENDEAAELEEIAEMPEEIAEEDTASAEEAVTQEFVLPLGEEELTEKPKKGGLFSLFRRAAKSAAEEAAPDEELYDQISEEAEDPSAGESVAEETFDASEVEEEAEACEEVSDEGYESATEEIADAVEQEAPQLEMDDTDLNLMVAFGLEDQLDEQAGVGTADMIAAQNDEAVLRHEQEQRRALEYEYTERAQTPKIAEAYKYSFRVLKWKLLLAGILTLLLFFFENISIFGVQFAGVFDPAVYPVVYCMTSLQLMLLVCAIAYEQIFTGIANLLTARPTPESVTAVLSVFGVLYTAYAALVSVQGDEPVMYNFAVAVCVFMTLLFAYFNTKREMFSFNVVSSKKPKYIMHHIASDEVSPESEAFGYVNDDDPDVLRIQKTSFVDGYFGRTSAILHTTRVYVTAMLTTVVAASVLLAVLAAIGGAGAKDAVTVAYTAILAALPMSMFLTYSYPFYKANREAYEYDSTIVGESSLEEYSGASIISFDDTNVFPSYGVKVQNIKIYNNNRIDRILYYAASVFAAAGGPLNDVFEVATIEMGHSDDVELVGADVGYLEAVVDGRHIIFGRSGVLTEMGIEIPEEIVEEDSYIEGDLGIMYMIRDGALIAKMFIKYVMDADFEFILRQFTQNGTCVCVNTFDPNVDADMILSKVKGKKYPLRVIKNSIGDSVTEHAESGIVTRGTTKSLLQVVSYCDMVLGVKRTNLVISVVSAVISLAIMLIVALSGSIGMIASWLIVLNQLFWMLPGMLTTKLYIK